MTNVTTFNYLSIISANKNTKYDNALTLWRHIKHISIMLLSNKEAL